MDENNRPAKLLRIATLIKEKGMAGLTEQFSLHPEREKKRMQRIQDNMKKSGRDVPILMTPTK